ncbi:hypothetical protein E2562_030250 [Oryza meyeriana var. granulata]|uniref:SET domain-containing protein n=1 Tax=Oryza meyeriana var. granulata TaxID=110450 RepID=A0A6G1D9Z1_9ORYZ|nr:hypothetical protein E2562_030250 [Oryza meyeriana var. granulata]
MEMGMDTSPSPSSSAPSSASSDSIDLNFLPFLKREPKSEPASPERGPLPLPAATPPPPLQVQAQAAATAASPLPATPDLSAAAVMTPLQSLPPNPEEETLLAEYYRLASLYLSSSAGAAGVIVPAPTPEASAGAVVQPGSGSAAKKRRPRSSELVRVSSLSVRDQIYFRDLVRRARITFESLRAMLLRDDERAEALGLTGVGGFGAVDRRRVRADLRAAALMGDRDLWLNRDRRIVGPIPGISVGDAFFFRMELCVLGLHGQVQAGIDFVTAGQSSSGEPIATSIIVSGGYEDDDDRGDVLVYTGHGGRDPNLHKHCIDQKLEGGNLALERSMAYGIEIRVIRAVKSKRSPIGKVYFYDGLYKVVDFWLDRGKSGFGVYKYKMLRIEGQEAMGSVNFRLAEQLKVNALTFRPTGYLSFDISLGRESIPVALYNDVDDDRDPLLFEYLARPIFPSSAVQGKFAEGGGGCECNENCSIGCYCAQRNSGEFAYDKVGALLRGKPLVYECGPYCRCPPSCPNRVSQKGLKNRLEVFRSRETGWGVRSLDLIKAGTFICEFSGIVLTHQQSEIMSANGDCLVRPSRFPPRWLDWGDVSDVYPEYVAPNNPAVADLKFSIDVSRARNVACYFSHSCSPNVFVQFVLFDHYNISYPHLMIFAMENIPPLRELSIDYGMIDEWVGKLTM